MNSLNEAKAKVRNNNDSNEKVINQTTNGSNPKDIECMDVGC